MMERGCGVAASMLAIALLGQTGCGDPGETHDSPTALPKPPERIFLFVVDTLRQDHVSAYGARAKTPRMDALAARGQRIDGALSAYYQTTMSMGALFTGRTPALESDAQDTDLPWTGRTWCGFSRFSSPEDKSCVPQNLTTLAERLREAGYWTAGITANRLLFDPAAYSQGFDRWEEVGTFVPKLGMSLQNKADFVQTRIEQVLGERDSDRFFLYAHWIDVHDYQRDYAKSVEVFDAAFGTVLDELEAQGLLENSWILLTSDHGESLGEMTPLGRRRLHRGNPAFDPELKIPLIVAPAIFPADAELVRSQDVSRLLLEALGLEPLTPEPDFEADEHFLSESTYQTYRRGNFKSMRARKTGEFLLFDLTKDPGERRNVAAQHPAVVAEHDARIRALTEEFRSEVEVPKLLTLEDALRLRALGYADDSDAAPAESVPPSAH